MDMPSMRVAPRQHDMTDLETRRLFCAVLFVGVVLWALAAGIVVLWQRTRPDRVLSSEDFSPTPPALLARSRAPPPPSQAPRSTEPQQIAPGEGARRPVFRVVAGERFAVETVTEAPWSTGAATPRAIIVLRDIKLEASPAVVSAAVHVQREGSATFTSPFTTIRWGAGSAGSGTDSADGPVLTHTRTIRVPLATLLDLESALEGGMYRLRFSPRLADGTALPAAVGARFYVTRPSLRPAELMDRETPPDGELECAVHLLGVASTGITAADRLSARIRATPEGAGGASDSDAEAFTTPFTTTSLVGIQSPPDSADTLTLRVPGLDPRRAYSYELLLRAERPGGRTDQFTVTLGHTVPGHGMDGVGDYW